MIPEPFRRRDLPHWDVPGATYFVTSCLNGSIPARGLADLDRYKQSLAARQCPEGVSKDDWDERCWKLEFARTDQWLDQFPEARHLERPEAAEIVMNSLLHFAGERIEVYALIVMPSHFHWVFRPLDVWVAEMTPIQQRRSPREQIMHSVKAFSSRRCNVLLGRQGVFWQAESYDHWVRDGDELERIIHYVENNPVKAGLVKSPDEWRYSSARLRKEMGLVFGSPIRKPGRSGDPPPREGSL